MHVDRVLEHVNAEDPPTAISGSRLDSVNGAGSHLSCRAFCGTRWAASCTRSPSIPTYRFRGSRAHARNARRSSQLVRRSGSARSASPRTPTATGWPWPMRAGTSWITTTCSRLPWTRRWSGLRGPVVVNLTTSSVVDDVAQAHGCRVFRTPVGEANVVETMRRCRRVIGGEGSNGGIIFPAVHLCRDSYTGMAFLLQPNGGYGLYGFGTVALLAEVLPQARQGGV